MKKSSKLTQVVVSMGKGFYLHLVGSPICNAIHFVETSSEKIARYDECQITQEEEEVWPRAFALCYWKNKSYLECI